MPGTSKGAVAAWQTRRREEAWRRQQRAQDAAATSVTGLSRGNRDFLYRWAVRTALDAQEVEALLATLKVAQMRQEAPRAAQG